MKELALIEIKKPKLPIKWNYDSSVKKVGGMIYKWKSMTGEILQELWIAREILKNPGARSDLKKTETWEKYCEDIQIDRTTAHRWLDRHFNLVANATRLETPEFPNGKFPVIYADPPWQFDNSGFEQSAASIYQTMPTEEISKLPISEIAPGESVLFLWATNAMLEDALKVMEAWGFEYKSNLVWIKDKSPGMGWFTQSMHELLLIGVKGGNWHPREKPKSWIKSEVIKHSQKPTVFYNIIESMYKGPYLELFARNIRKGWSSWGNEIEGN